MRTPHFVSAVTLLVLAGSAALAAEPPSAASLMEHAYKQARAEHKPVFVKFHASWCGWCKKLDAMLEKPDVAKQFDKNYVMVTLDVLENGDAKKLENAGAGALLDSLGGKEGGIPFYAVLDANGKKLADSHALPGGANIGYPDSPAEIDAFMGILKKTEPHWTSADSDTLVAYLKDKGSKALPAAH